MRVIAGEAKGRKLKELPGLDTRPTTDRVKEGIFNVVQFDIEGRRVLDLFSGTGQMGIEALSRGAAHAVFVDSSRDAVSVIQANITTTQMTQRTQVVPRDALAFIVSRPEKFDLLFLDPPYHTPLLTKTLETIAAIDIVSENGIIVCESALDEELPTLEAPYQKGREYRYGKIKVTLYHRGACV